VINLGSILPVGTIIHSMLTTTQFTAEYGDNWVLADGRSVTGSKYAAVTSSSTIPDMRGAFLRAKGSTYNPDGDLALGTYTADKNKILTGLDAIAAGADTIARIPGNRASPSNLYDNETAPRSITVNVFIRIN
jgi:hypothetical protein